MCKRLKFALKHQNNIITVIDLFTVNFEHIQYII